MLAKNESYDDLDLSDISNQTIKKDDNCKELKNIAYKTMLMNGNNINPIYEDISKNQEITNFLENESSNSKKEIWSKLDKTQKILKFDKYIKNVLKKNYNLQENEISTAKTYLVRCLDRKCLLKSKEVIYDKDSGEILNIPNLHFDSNNRNFLLKKDDKRVSTVKSLPSDKKQNKQKTIKIHD